MQKFQSVSYRVNRHLLGGGFFCAFLLVSGCTHGKLDQTTTSGVQISPNKTVHDLHDSTTAQSADSSDEGKTNKSQINIISLPPIDLLSNSSDGDNEKKASEIIEIAENKTPKGRLHIEHSLQHDDRPGSTGRIVRRASVPKAVESEDLIDSGPRRLPAATEVPRLFLRTGQHAERGVVAFSDKRTKFPERSQNRLDQVQSDTDNDRSRNKSPADRLRSVGRNRDYTNTHGQVHSKKRLSKSLLSSQSRNSADIDKIETGSVRISSIMDSHSDRPGSRARNTRQARKSNSGFLAVQPKTHQELASIDAELNQVKIVGPDGYPETTDVPKQGKQTLDLSRVIEFTLANNPELAIANAQEEDARIGIEVEEADYKPQVDLTISSGLDNTYTTSTTAVGVDRNEINISVRQTLLDFGATESAVERQKALYRSAELRTEDKEEEITLDVIKSYLNYLRQVDLVASSARNIAAHKKIAKLVQLSEEGGNATVADVKRVETRLDAANSRKISNDNALKDAASAFRRVTDLDPGIIKRPRRLIPKNAGFVVGDINSNIINNPKLRSLEADRYSLEKQLKQQQASLYPELYAMGEANYKSNVSGESGLARDFKGMLVLKMRLFDGGKRLKTAGQIQQRIYEADAQRHKLFRELAQNFEQNEQVLLTNQEKAGFLRDGVNAARKVTSLYTQQFQAGTRSPFELLDAQRDLHRAEQEVINHRYDSALAGYQALRLRGDLVQSLTY